MKRDYEINEKSEAFRLFRYFRLFRNPSSFNKRSNRGEPMQTFWRDLRYATRLLLKKPGFTLLAVLTLALGIGANTAILSTVNGFIIRQLPVNHPEELVQPFWGSSKELEVWHQFSYPNYADL